MGKLLSNIDASLLSKFLPEKTTTDLPGNSSDLVNETKARAVVPRTKRAKHGEHKSFGDIIRDDSGWLYEKVGTILLKDVTQRLSVMFQRQLWQWGHSFVLSRFMYQNSEMDLMSIVHDQVNEFEIKCCRLDYLKDFSKCVYKGRAINKHGLLKAGKFITNRFWYVCPAGLIDLEHLPEYAGLIYFLDKPKIDEEQFVIVKEAPFLHTDRVTPGFYKTLATRLYDRHVNMVKRYCHSSVVNFYRYGKIEGTESETTSDQVKHNASDTHQDNAGG